MSCTELRATRARRERARRGEGRRVRGRSEQVGRRAQQGPEGSPLGWGEVAAGAVSPRAALGRMLRHTGPGGGT